MQRSPYRDLVAQAAIRRAAFMRDEVQSGRVPATHPLGASYLAQVERLELMYPPQLHDDADQAVNELRAWLDQITPDDFR